jgi:branched-chain amino acid transport system ATP-binding protein
MLLELEGVRAGYGDLEVIYDIDLHIEAGEVVTLLGANGAGKSTTLKTIVGVITPTAGTIRFDQQRIDGKRIAEIVRLGLSFCPEGRELFPDMTVYETLLLGAFSLRLPKKEMSERIDEVFTLFPKLDDRRKQRAGTMSGGEQQMLAIGRSLMLRPKLLLLDEPSLGLAPRLVDEVMAAIHKVRSSETTVLLVEQNASLALDLCDRAYVMEAGAIVMHGDGPTLVQSPELRRRYLGEEDPETAQGT